MENEVGLCGVGNMGRGILSKLMNSRLHVWAYDPAPRAQELIKSTEAKLAASPREVAEKADVVILSLPGPKEIESLVLGEHGILEALTREQVVADTSTGDPDTTRRIAEKVAARGAFYLDTPVLGRPHTVGTWVLPAGGAAEALDRIRPILHTFAAKVILVGPSGAGNSLKLLNNMMFSAINAITAEIMAIAAKSALSPKVLWETIACSTAATVSPLFKEAGRKIVERDFEPLFSLDLLCKDAGLGIEMAKNLGAPAIVSSAIQSINLSAQVAGLGAEDTSALVRVFEELYSENRLKGA